MHKAHDLQPQYGDVVIEWICLLNILKNKQDFQENRSQGGLTSNGRPRKAT